jgi:hypothetical protein
MREDITDDLLIFDETDDSAAALILIHIDTAEINMLFCMHTIQEK